LRIKVLSLGASAVGKSTLIKRYCEGRFVQKYITTIGIDYGVKPVKVLGQDLKVNFFDTSGGTEFHDIRVEFYNDTDAALLVYDVTNRKSFQELDNWLAEAKRHRCPVSKLNYSGNVPCIVARVTRTLLLSASAATAFRLMPTPIGHVNRIASATAIAAPLIVSSRSLGIRASADDLEAQIKATVSESKVVVYSKSWCPFCQKTKATLSDLGIEFNAIELDELDDGAEIQDTLLAVTGQRTVPNVFVGGQHLGGNDDTQKAAKSGKLAEMLK